MASGGKRERIATRGESQEPVVLTTTVVLITTVVLTTNYNRCDADSDLDRFDVKLPIADR